MRSPIARLLVAGFAHVAFWTTASAQAACRMSSWSTRQELFKFVGDSFTLRPTDIASSDGRVVIVSEFPDSFEERRYRFADGYHVGLDVDTRTLRSVLVRLTWPKASYADPRVGIDGAGIAHVLWQESAGISTSDSTGGRGSVQLWSGRIRDGEVVDARLLLANESLKRPSRLVRDHEGRLHFLVDQWTSPVGPLLMHVASTASGWKVDTVPQGTFSFRMNTDLRVVGDTIHIVYTEADDLRSAGGGEDYNSVWYMRSNDRGRTWLPRVRVRLSGLEPAYALLLEVTNSSRLVVVWRQQFLARRGRADVITGARSDDGGLTWHTLPEIGALVAPRDVASIWSDRCGQVHLHLVDGGLGESLRAYNITLSGDRWGALERLATPNKGVGRSVIVQERDGTIHRFFPSVDWVPGTIATVFLHYSQQRPVVPH